MNKMLVNGCGPVQRSKIDLIAGKKGWNPKDQNKRGESSISTASVYGDNNESQVFKLPACKVF